MKKWIVFGSLLLASVAYGQDGKAGGEETCIQEKMLIQQLSAQNASLIFNNAQAERARLENLQKAKEAVSNGTIAPPPAPTPEAPPAPQ